MRKNLKWFLPVTALFATPANAGATFQQEQFVASEPTGAQISACLADELKFCDIKVVDRNEIKMCLLRHKAQLSKACQEAFK
jgi:hypothetical protein